MPIKQPAGGVTGQDFTDALESLRVSVAEVASATKIPRTYLSDLRNHGTPLRREYAAKLRDWLIGEGIEFDDAEPGGAPATPKAKPQQGAGSPHPRLAVETVSRCYFPIAEDVPSATVTAALDRMDANDARMVELFKSRAKRETGLLGDGGFDANTIAVMQEAFTLMAENYIVFRMLRGWPAFDRQPEKQDVESVRDVVFGTFEQALLAAGLIAPEKETEPVEEGAEA